MENDPDVQTLFLLVGDHGMNEIGNHGGSSWGETAAAAVFISPSFHIPNPPLKLKTINQMDLVPTISGISIHIKFSIVWHCSASK